MMTKRCVTHLSGGEWWRLNRRIMLRLIEHNRLDEPFKRFAAETLAHFALLADVARIGDSHVFAPLIEILGVLVHPDGGNALVVLQ